VADVGGEPALQRAELLQLADLLLDALGHRVVRLAEPGHLVVTVHRHPLVEVPVGEPFGDLRGQPDGAHHLPRDQAGDAGQQQQQDQPADDQRALHQAQRALLGRQREQQVELQRRVRGSDRLPDQQRRHLGRGAVRALVGERHVLAGERALGHLLAQVRWHVLDRPRGHLGAAVRAAGGEHRAELPGRGRRRVVGVGVVGQPVEGVAELALRALAVRIDGGQVPFQQHPAGVGPGEGVGLLGPEHAQRDLGLQDQPEHHDHGGGQGQRADHDPHLQRASPDRAEGIGQVAAELAQLRDPAPGPVPERQRGHGVAASITGVRPCTRRRAR
jgi:hypothetical protein